MEDPRPPILQHDRPLEERFLEFVRSIEGTELIDELDLTPQQEKTPKADFFFEDRRIICELKSLQTDTKPKIDAVLEPYRDSEHWPVFYGTWSVSKVIAHLPNGEELNERILKVVTTSVKDHIRKANAQIRSTKEQFDLPTSHGLLVILNDLVEVISPEVLVHRVMETLRKRHADGSPQHPHIDCVCTFNETHYVDLSPTLRGVPSMIITNGPEESALALFIDSLQARWAKSQGLPLVEMKVDRLDTDMFRPWSALEELHQPEVKRSDLWRQQYRLQPYLRKLRKRDLLRRGRQLLMAIEPMFLKDAPPVQEQRRYVLMIPWAHFLEEISHRGIDMRELKPPERWQHRKKKTEIYRELKGRPQQGRFYTDPETAFSYCCESSTPRQVVLYMVESYHPDNGVLIQARVTYREKEDWELLEVTDQDEVDRLQEIYRHAVPAKKKKRRSKAKQG